MKNFCITILAFSLITIELSAQVKMVISDVKVHKAQIFIPKGEGIIGGYFSPYIEGKLCITNDSEKPNMIYNDKFMLFFNYKGLTYRQELYMNKNETIMPCDTVFIKYSCDLFGGTSLKKAENDVLAEDDILIDYTMELLEVLPTVRIRYQDSLHEYWATCIENVSIVNEKNDYY